MRFANAGHPKPLHVRRSENRVDPLTNASGKSQPALGLFETAVYQKSEVQLASNDFVMLFTDGLYEVLGPKNDLYTQELLIAAVKERAQLPASQLFDGLLKEIERFSAGEGFTDDVCLVGLELSSSLGSKL
jgi:sigma-B regulation protein RsbU (phosphoserine phosphatase)